jgi:hypothetical protein
MLYEKVVELHQKPIRIIEKIGKGDSTIDTHGDEIILTLRRGCSEDIIAHELMHGILHAEHYPTLVGITLFPLSKQLSAICRADLDHLIINDRLLGLGYDAQEGFLSHVDGYENILKLDPGRNPESQAVHLFCLLNQLIKFHCYIGDPNAEEDILAKFPEVEEYWETLSGEIGALPPKPGPADLWGLGATYLGIGDEICRNVNAPFLITDLLVIEPLPVSRSDLAKKAHSMFGLTTQTLDGQLVLLRIFTVTPHVMVHCYAVPAQYLPPQGVSDLSVRDYLEGLEINHVVVE